MKKGNPGEKPIVLVVEDEKDLADNICEIVQSSGKYVGLTATSALEAYNQLEENQTVLGTNHIKLILLDIKMPGVDGLQFLEEIRKKHKTDFGVIMVTAFEDEEKWHRALSGKVIGYIKKPFSADQITRALDSYFEGSDSTSAMRISTYDKYFEKFKKFRRF